MLMMVMILQGCGASGQSVTTTTPDAQTQSESAQIETDATDDTSEATEETTEAAIQLDPSLDLANYANKWVYVTEQPQSQRGQYVVDDSGNLIYQDVQPCYVLTDIPYCLNPVDSSIQMMDIYVPEEYMDAKDNGDGTFTCTVKRDGTFTNPAGTTFTGANAPVIVQNTIDGYAQGERLQLTSGRKGGGVGTYESYLQSGYVLVSIGSRGITSTVDGTAPACVVDLKAGIRLLKANADLVPGDVDKIVTTGTSAGGSVASILGASGNSHEYDPYLEEIGAIMGAKDDVYCAMVFCPITNLGIADAAFEWLHSSETASGGFGGMMGDPMGGGPGGMMGGPMGGDNTGGEAQKTEFTEFEVALHDALIEAYKNDLKEMGIDPDEFYQGFLDKINECVTYYADNYGGERYTVESVEEFVSENMGRNKGVPSFDGLDANKKENELFDTEHFSAELKNILEDLSETYPEAAEVLNDYKEQITDEKQHDVDLMTPNYFIVNGDTDVAPFWRFRIGTMDGDIGAVAAWNIASLLEKDKIADVDYALVWGVGHMSADYSYDDVQTYIDSICN